CRKRAEKKPEIADRQCGILSLLPELGTVLIGPPASSVAQSYFSRGFLKNILPLFTEYSFRLANRHILSDLSVVELETLLDNLSVDPVTGDVWTGGHPNGMKLFYYDPKDLPGSEIVRIQTSLGQPHSDHRIPNDGSVIQGHPGSVYGNKLFIGTIFQKSFCASVVTSYWAPNSPREAKKTIWLEGIFFG
ncbi:unnamed protein product, partial [Ranitomeya imitator]